MTGDLGPETEDSAFSAERCRYFEGLFSPYIAGDLDLDSRRALAEHLHQCEACAERFGLAWKAEATEKAGGQLSPVGQRLRPKVGGLRRRMLWVMVAVCGFAVVMLMNQRNSGGGFGQSAIPVPSGRALLDEEVGRTIALQNRLLEVLVEPLQGQERPISHSARGEARDWFESFGRARAQGIGELVPMLHSLARVIDSRPGGNLIDRNQIVQSWREEGQAPDLVLVEVRDATRETTFCQGTWGGSPAYFFLVREKQQGDAASARVGSWTPLRLALVLLTTP
jgi:hypothetical protein